MNRPTTMYLFARETRLPTMLFGFTADSEWNAYRLRRTYRELRQAGISADAARDLMFNTVAAGLRGQFADKRQAVAA